MTKKIMLFLFFCVMSYGELSAQINEYIVKRTDTPIIIDGKMTETQWEKAEWTEVFVNQKTGAAVEWGTQAKLLWDDQYLYVGFKALDDDVWGEMTDRDAYLWEEEPVELFCDPDNDTKNYFEIEINPLGTVLDLSLDKAYSEGGTADFGWDLNGFKSAVSIVGTLNDPTDTDTCWYCEMAIPFSGIDTIMTQNISNPPLAGDIWRVLLARYNRKRDSDGNLISGGSETSAWNITEGSFHVPEKFGKIIFSADTVTAVNETLPVKVRQFNLKQNYPNPFNPKTTIGFFIPQKSIVKVEVYNALGVKVAEPVNENLPEGAHSLVFDASPLASGVYLYKVTAGRQVAIKKMLLIK